MHALNELIKKKADCAFVFALANAFVFAFVFVLVVKLNTALLFATFTHV